jgi:hypothetical protein
MPILSTGFTGCMSASPVIFKLKPEQQELLETWVRAHGTPQQDALPHRVAGAPRVQRLSHC